MEEEEAAVSSAEENKAIVRRFLEELDKGNLDVIDELLSPDFVDRALMPGQGSTRENFKRTIVRRDRAARHRYSSASTITTTSSPCRVTTCDPSRTVRRHALQ